METNHQISQHTHFKKRWRNSINQFTKLSEETQLAKLDTLYQKISKFKLKMKNRLGQIDDEFQPAFVNKNKMISPSLENDKHHLASTNHQTDFFTIGFSGKDLKVQQSLIIRPLTAKTENKQKLIFYCQQVREELIEQLTEFNESKYRNQMSEQCSKYNHSFISKLYSLIDHPKKQIYEFCYSCDEIIKGVQQNQTKSKLHQCKTTLTSMFNVQLALIKIKEYVEDQKNKIFHIFLHNAIQSQTSIQQLISNLNVLKQSLQMKYDPEEAVLKLRLINLIAKKIGLLIEEKQLQDRLKSLSKSKN